MAKVEQQSVSAVPARPAGDRTRSAILDAALAEFVAHGFSATSMATVARAAGVTKSLIHHHFGSKHELWNAVKALVMDDYGRVQQRLLEERAPDLTLVRDSLVAYFRFLQDHPNVVRLWAWMVVEGDSDCADLTKQLRRASVAALRAAQDNGSIRRDVDAEAVLAQLFTLVRGWFSERAFLQCSLFEAASDRSCDERYLRATLKVFLDGLKPAR